MEPDKDTAATPAGDSEPLHTGRHVRRHGRGRLLPPGPLHPPGSPPLPPARPALRPARALGTQTSHQQFPFWGIPPTIICNTTWQLMCCTHSTTVSASKLLADLHELLPVCCQRSDHRMNTCQFLRPLNRALTTRSLNIMHTQQSSRSDILRLMAPCWCTLLEHAECAGAAALPQSMGVIAIRIPHFSDAQLPHTQKYFADRQFCRSLISPTFRGRRRQIHDRESLAIDH